MIPHLTRRQFLRVSLLAGGGLLIEACTRAPGTITTTTTAGTTTTSTSTTTTSTTSVPALDPEAVFEPNVRVRIDASGGVTVTGHRSEMGQGILTAMAMIVAEELDADWATVTVEQADADSAYGSQVTGGSTAIDETYRLLREAGAEARARFVGAAARRWQIDPAICATKAGTVSAPDGRTLDYGALVEEAAALDTDQVPELPLKAVADFVLIGTPQVVAHSTAVLTGTAIYGSDVTLPNMRYAAIAYPPVFGASAASHDASAALAVPGVDQVIAIPAGVAVVAADTWSAIRGRDAVAGTITWEGGRTNLDSVAIAQEFRDDAAGEIVYEHPFYAHLSIEPMSCVVDLRRGSCEVWAPVQLPQDAQRAVATITGLPTADVTLHVPLSGGRFGRGLHIDYVEHAAHVARAVSSPVKLVWTREDDVRRDFFHPLAAVVATSDPADPLRTIRLQPRRAAGVGIPTGNWRAVGEFTQGFARESYFDELAHSLGLDPVDARLQILDDRAAEVVRSAARESGWGSAMPAGSGRGIAHYSTWGATEVSQVAEVTVSGPTIRVDRVVCAVDCGMAINPDGVRAQMEGGIAWGLAAALHNGIDISGGRVVQSNYHDAPVLRADQMPRVEVHILESSEDPSGIGEMGVPPLAPAVANAVFAATGIRLRSLPLRLGT